MKLSLFLSTRFSRGSGSGISKSVIIISRLVLAISYVIILITLSTGIGLNKAISDKIISLNGHIVIANLLNNGEEETYLPLEDLNNNILEPLKFIEGIKYYQPFITKSAVIQFKKKHEAVLVKGVSKDYNFTIFKNFLREGTVPDYGTSQISREILISERIARQLSLDVGDYLKAYFFSDLSQEHAVKKRTLKVSGIFDTSFKEYDEAIVISDIRLLRGLNGWDNNQVGGLEIILKDQSALEKKEQEIYNSIDGNVESMTVKKKYPAIFEWIDVFYFNIIVIFVVVILVSSVSISITLLVLVIERISLIGLLKSIGMRNLTIRKSFIYTAMNIIFNGLLWGNVIGLSLLFIQKYTHFIELDPRNYYVSSVPVYLTFEMVFVLNVLLLCLCLTVLVIPSYIITKVRPVRAITYA